MQRPSAAAKYVLQRRTRSHLRGSLQTHTQEWAYKHGTSLSPPHTSSASQNVSQSIPRSVSRLAFKSRQQAKQPEGLIIHPTNRPERLETSPASQKRTHPSKTHHPAGVLVPLPLCHFLGPGGRRNLIAAQMVFRGSSVSSLSAQLLREDARNYNQQPVPTPQRSEFITPAPATGPAQVFRPSQCLSCHFPFSLYGFMYEIWKSLAC